MSHLLPALLSWFTRMPGESYDGPLVPLSSEALKICPNLKRHVHILATEIGPRNMMRYSAMCSAANYIARELQTLTEEINILPYTVDGKDAYNIEVTFNARNKDTPLIVVGAHYDSAGECPAANDNASGVAAMIEIARLMATDTPKGRAELRLVAFANEEPPYFLTSKMGSRVYAQSLRRRHHVVRGMISLETIGYYSDDPGSQHYPFPLDHVYPPTGNFIAFVGNLSSRAWLHKVVQAFRDNVPFPSEGACLPCWVPGVSWSDQWSFWKEGWDSIMITDTAPYRYPFYHTTQDTPDKIDYQRLSIVTAGLARVLRNLVEAEEGSPD